MKKRSNLSPALVLLAIINLVGLIIVGMGVWQNREAFEKSQKIQTRQTVNATYKCSDNKTIGALFFNNTVEIVLSDGRNLMLIQGVSGSGTRYTNNDESITFWNEGNTAFVEEDNNQTFKNCTQTPQ